MIDINYINRYRQKKLDEGRPKAEVDAFINQKIGEDMAVNYNVPVSDLQDSFDNRFLQYQQIIKNGGYKSKEDIKAEREKEESLQPVKGLVQEMDKLKARVKNLNVGDIPANALGLSSEVNQFNQSKALATQYLAKMVEKNRLSDADRRFYTEEIMKLSPYGLQKPKEQQIDNLIDTIGGLAGFTRAEMGLEDAPQQPKDANLLSKVKDFMLGSSLNVTKDVSTAMAQKNSGANESIQAAIDSAAQLEQKAKDPATTQEESQRLMNLAQQIYQKMGVESNNMSEAYSPDIQKGALERGLSSASEIAAIAEIPAAVKGIQAFGKKALSKGGQLVEKAPELLRPGTVGTQTRNVIIDAAEKQGKQVSGSRLMKAVEAWAPKAKRANPADVARINKYVKGARTQFAKKTLSIREAFDLWLDASKGYTASNSRGRSLEAGFHRVVRDALRPDLEFIAPGFDKTTKLISEGIGRGKFGKRLVHDTTKGIIQGGITGLVLGKLLQKRGNSNY